MIAAMAGLLMTIGIMMMTYHIWSPVTVADFLSGSVQVNNISGVVLLLVGCVILGVRIRQTGVSGVLDLPKEDRIQVFYQAGHSQNTKILNGKLMDDNLILADKKLMHYKGGGFRIAGHECIRVHGNIVANIPEKIGEVLMRYKEKYKVDNINKLWKLYVKLQHLNTTDDLIEQLKEIPELSHITEDEVLLKDFASMSVKDIKSMAETLWDGTTMRLDPDVDEFIQTATPAQVYHYAQREFIARDKKSKSLKTGGATDWAKYAIPIGVLLFMAALGIGVFLQMSGS
jgi:hypothetical protein